MRRFARGAAPGQHDEEHDEGGGQGQESRARERHDHRDRAEHERTAGDPPHRRAPRIQQKRLPAIGMMRFSISARSFGLPAMPEPPL